jgi:hypothetical protein
LAGKLELYSLINEGLEQTKDGKTKPMKESINLMNKPRIYVDFNEMIDENIVLLSVNDSKMDSEGNVIQFCEGLPVYIYSNDIDENGNEDNLIANGFATKYDLSKDKHWSHVKWCCKIDLDGIIHESDLKKNDGVRANDT